MKSNVFRVFLAAVCWLLFNPGVASAGLVGSTVGVAIYSVPTQGGAVSALFGPDSVVVGPSVELPSYVNGAIGIDIGDSSLRIDFKETGPFPAGFFVGFLFNGWTDVEMLGFTSGTSDVAGLDISRLLFDAGDIAINMQGLAVTAGNFIELGLSLRTLHIDRDVAGIKQQPADIQAGNI